MNKTSKILVTIVATGIMFILFAAIVGIRTDNGNSTPGILGLAIGAGYLGAIRAIWKKNKHEN